MDSNVYSTAELEIERETVIDLFDSGDITAREALGRLAKVQRKETEVLIALAIAERKHTRVHLLLVAGLVVGALTVGLLVSPYVYPRLFGYRYTEDCLLNAKSSWAAGACYDLYPKRPNNEKKAEIQPVEVPRQVAQPPEKSAPAASTTNPGEVSLPANGEIVWYDSPKEGVAPLEVKAPKGSNYLVKLTNANTNEDLMTIFVLGGSTVNVHVPLGAYIIKYATGERWYGYDLYFGRETLYAKADRLFNFSRQSNGYSGYTVTLYRVKDGNLKTTSIGKSEF